MLKKPLQPTLARIIAIIVPIVLLHASISAMAASVTLRWDPNTPTPEGYRVFARRSDQAYNYSQPHWQGKADTCTLNTLADQSEYFFVVRAYDGPMESADSIEAHYIPPVSDSDNDGMPDNWEIDFGLNPAMDDADGDLDGDGISNRDEYRAGLKPDHPGAGNAPVQPAAIHPESEALVKHDPVLDAGNFSDTDGDAHIATQWQIFDAGSEACLLDAVSDSRLNDLKIPLLLLKGDTRYYWRARFFDSGGKASLWSLETHFITEAAENDLDGNGIPDDREGDGLTAVGFHTLSSPTAAGVLTGIRTDPEDTISVIEQAFLVDPVTFDMDVHTPDQLPLEMVAYKLILTQPGQQAWVTIDLSGPAPAGARWVKYDEVNGWEDYSDHAQFSADRRSVTLSVKDGGFGDADGVVNGIIIDPSGLATNPESGISTSGGGGGGCFLTTVHNDADQFANQKIYAWRWLQRSIGRLLAVVIPTGADER
ncbi:choice-of-anchor U domain-containing protein [Desulfosarcina sp.]|uniref:choice-of-anchor U domain-containing protein n=1 Tax=Desulfosarcina sp. TaxID=2027861 RepID=UPI0039708B5E